MFPRVLHSTVLRYYTMWNTKCYLWALSTRMTYTLHCAWTPHRPAPLKTRRVTFKCKTHLEIDKAAIFFTYSVHGVSAAVIVIVVLVLVVEYYVGKYTCTYSVPSLRTSTTCSVTEELCDLLTNWTGIQQICKQNNTPPEHDRSKVSVPPGNTLENISEPNSHIFSLQIWFQVLMV